MAKINITVENEKDFRKIKRNSSNQIVSYDLPEENSDISLPTEYGYRKIAATVKHFNRAEYQRTLPRLSNELVNELPDGSSEIINRNSISENKLYVRGVPITGVEPDNFVDVFSGRYEITEAASSFRTPQIIDYARSSKDGWKDKGHSSPDTNTHIIPPGYLNDGIRKRPEKVRKEKWDNIKFDKAVTGPPLEDGKYRITQELKDSGKDLYVRCTVGLMNVINKYGNVGNSYPATYYMRLKHFLPPYGGSQSVRNRTEKTKSVEMWTWPYQTVDTRITNEEMKVGALVYAEHYTSTGYSGFCLMGNKSIFEFQAVDPLDNFNWPPNENDENDGQSSSNTIEDSALEDVTRDVATS